MDPYSSEELSTACHTLDIFRMQRVEERLRACQVQTNELPSADSARTCCVTRAADGVGSKRRSYFAEFEQTDVWSVGETSEQEPDNETRPGLNDVLNDDICVYEPGTEETLQTVWTFPTESRDSWRRLSFLCQEDAPSPINPYLAMPSCPRRRSKRRLAAVRKGKRKWQAGAIIVIADGAPGGSDHSAISNSSEGPILTSHIWSHPLMNGTSRERRQAQKQAGVLSESVGGPEVGSKRSWWLRRLVDRLIRCKPIATA